MTWQPRVSLSLTYSQSGGPQKQWATIISSRQGKVTNVTETAFSIELTDGTVLTVEASKAYLATLGTDVAATLQAM